MRIISHSTLVAFGSKNRAAMDGLGAWYHMAKRAKWSCMNDIVQAIPSTDPVGPKHVVFNICRNQYRLVTAVFFPQHTMWIKFIGDHAKYDALDEREL